MTIIIDTKEKGDGGEYLKLKCDEVRAIHVDDVDDPWQADIEVQCNDGTVYRFERKIWTDAIKSFFEGDLDRQASYVDALIIERRGDETGPTIGRGSVTSTWVEREESVMKHINRMSFAIMPVLFFKDETETYEFLRYIERLGKNVGDIRPNRMTHDGRTAKERVASALPGIGQKKVRDAVHAIDWGTMETAIITPTLLETKGVGPGTIKKIRDALQEE